MAEWVSEINLTAGRVDRQMRGQANDWMDGRTEGRAD